MMNYIRVLIMKTVTVGLVLFGVMAFSTNVIIKTRLVDMFYAHQFDAVFITVVIGLLGIILMSLVFMTWIWIDPEEAEEKKEIDMGSVKNVPNK